MYCCVTFKLQATEVFYISGMQICCLEKSDLLRDVFAVSIAEDETRCVLSLIPFTSRDRGGVLQSSNTDTCFLDASPFLLCQESGEIWHPI